MLRLRKGVKAIRSHNSSRKNFIWCLRFNSGIVRKKLKIDTISKANLSTLSKFLVIDGTCNKLWSYQSGGISGMLKTRPRTKDLQTFTIADIDLIRSVKMIKLLNVMRISCHMKRCISFSLNFLQIIFSNSTRW